jgi:hypothetical protein
LLKTLQFSPGNKSAHQQAIAALADQKIDEEVIKAIN